MSAYLEVVSKAPGAVPLVMVDGPPFTPWTLIGPKDLGNPSWQHQFAAARGTQGRRVVGGTPDDRTIVFGFVADNYATKDDLATDLGELARMVDEMRRYGGYVTWREHTQTRKQTAEVLVASAAIADWSGQEFDSRNTTRPALTLTCAPYLLGDWCDIRDEFTTDRLTADYIADAGVVATDLVVTGGQLKGAGTLTTERRLIASSTGYTHGDMEATVRFHPSGGFPTGFKAGAVLKRVDAANYLEVYIDDDGTNSRLRIDKVIAGSRTNLSTGNLTGRLASGRAEWVRGRIEGNTVYAEHFTPNQAFPAPSNTPATSRTYTLTAAEAAVLGVGIHGRAGFTFIPRDANGYIDEFEVLPWTYRRTAVEVIECDGDIPGDAPAVCDVRVGPCGNLDGVGTTWQLFAWEAAAGVRNLCQWGDFERNGTTGWTAAGVTGVTGAATSITAKTAGLLGAQAKFGVYAGEVVTPATANTGVAYPLYQRYLAGITYTATAWVRSLSTFTNVRVRLGVNGDIASSTPQALTPGWQQLTVTWTPSATVDVAYVAVEVTAATATTFHLDGVAVYRGASAPTGAQGQGMGAAPMLTVLRGEESILTTSLNLTRTANANANGGFAMVDTNVDPAGEDYVAGFVVDPSLSLPDDYTDGSIRIEVWARVMISAAFTGGLNIQLSAASEAGTSKAFPAEFGEAGRNVPLPSSGNHDKWRLTRLGTLDLRRDPASPSGRWFVDVIASVAAGTNNQDFALDDIFIVPERSRWLLPTGKPRVGFSSYPDFLPSADSIYRWVRSDLTSTVARTWAEGAAGGISGVEAIELPTGPVRILAVGSSQEPDDTVAYGLSEIQGGSSVHLRVRPRYHWIRPAS